MGVGTIILVARYIDRKHFLSRCRPRAMLWRSRGLDFPCDGGLGLAQPLLESLLHLDAFQQVIEVGNTCSYDLACEKCCQLATWST